MITGMGGILKWRSISGIMIGVKYTAQILMTHKKMECIQSSHGNCYRLIYSKEKSKEREEEAFMVDQRCVYNKEKETEMVSMK